MLTLKKVYQALSAELGRADSRLILLHRAGIHEKALVINGEDEIPPEIYNRILEDVARYKVGMPLSRIYGRGTFWGLDFDISPETLDPRQDTEVLIDLVTKRYAPDSVLNILDLGTGSGCILITLMKHFINAQGIGVDVSAEAVEVAKHNAQMHCVDSRVKFLNGSWFESLKNMTFDLIVSNPPYIARSVIPDLDENVRKYDPILALDGGEDGLFAYRQIFSELKQYLKPCGLALFEIGYDQAESILRLAGEYSLKVHNVHPDLAGRPRVVEISCGDK